MVYNPPPDNVEYDIHENVCDEDGNPVSKLCGETSGDDATIENHTEGAGSTFTENSVVLESRRETIRNNIEAGVHDDGPIPVPRALNAHTLSIQPGIYTTEDIDDIAEE